jgi:hypothetical protein
MLAQSRDDYALGHDQGSNRKYHFKYVERHSLKGVDQSELERAGERWRVERRLTIGVS